MPDDARSDASGAITPRSMQAMPEFPVREKILLAAALFLSHHMPNTAGVPSISKAILVFIAWAFFPESFGMRREGLMCDDLSWEAPDSNRVQAKIAGQDGVRGQGWLVEVEGKTGTEYALTKAGASKAHTILRKKFGGVPPAPKVELSERILKLLGIEEAFAAMKAALAKKEECPDSIKRPTRTEEEPERSDSPSTAGAIKPVAKRKRGGSSMDPISTKIEPVTPPQKPVVELIAPAPPEDPAPAPCDPASREDIQALKLLSGTPVAKKILNMGGLSRMEAVGFLIKFQSSGTEGAKIHALEQLLARVQPHLDVHRVDEDLNHFNVVRMTLDAVRKIFGIKS